MKGLRLTFLALCMACAFTVQAQYSGTSFAKAKQTKKAEVTYLYINTPGFSERAGSGVNGICPDIMQDFFDYVKQKYGITVTTKVVDKGDKYVFAQFLKDVSNGKGGVFGLGNITITDARKKFLTYSPPYIDNVTIILTNKSVPTLTDISNISKTFSGMTAVTIKNTTNEDHLMDIKKKYYPNMKISYVNNQNDALKRVANDKNTFTDLDFTYYLTGLTKDMNIKRHPGGDDRSEQFGIIMPKNCDWKKPFDEFLTNAYRTSPEYRKIIANHLGSNALKLLDAVGAK